MIKLKIVMLILLAEFWGVAGQIFYKKSVNSIETPNLRDVKSYVKFLKSVLAAPATWIGFSFITVGFLVWFLVLAQADLSLAFPIDSMQYVLTLVAAHIFLGEKVNRLKLTGTILVMGGILLVAIS